MDDDAEDDDGDCLKRFSNSSWTVPQIPSPPTASGLYWPKYTQYTPDNDHVSDIFFSDSQQFKLVQNHRTLSRRQRQP